MPRLNPFARAPVRLTRVWEATIDDCVAAVDASARHGLIAVASASGPVYLIDAATGAVRHTLAGHGFGATAVAWSACEQHLASAGQDGKVRLWDAGAGVERCECAGGAAWVEHLAWCPVRPILATAAGKKLRLWDAAGTLQREFLDHPKAIADLRWQPATDVLASTCYGEVRLWDVSAEEPTRRLEWRGSMIALAWSPDGRYLAAGAQDASVHFWVLATGEDLEMAGSPGKVRHVGWDTTGRFLATAGGPAVIVWDCSGKGPAGTRPLELETHTEAVTALACQHKGTLLASGGEDGVLALWQPGKQRGTIALAKLGGPVVQLHWATDDRTLVAGTADGKVVLYAVN